MRTAVHTRHISQLTCGSGRSGIRASRTRTVLSRTHTCSGCRLNRVHIMVVVSSLPTRRHAVSGTPSLAGARRACAWMSDCESGGSSDSTEDLSGNSDDELESGRPAACANVVVASAIAGGGCLIFKPDDVVRLRTKHRLVGRLVGTVPPPRPAKKPRRRAADAEITSGTLVVQPANNLFQKHGNKSGAGLPLFLTAEETAVAVTEKILQLSPPHEAAGIGTSGFDESLRPPPLLYDLWRRSFYVTAATKFGGEWLCYQADPISVHADYIVSHWPSAPDVWRSGAPPRRAARVDVAAALRAIGIKVSLETMRATGTTAALPASSRSVAAATLLVANGQDVQRSPADAGGCARPPPRLLHHGLSVGVELVAMLRLAAQAKKTLILAVAQQGQREGKSNEETQAGFTYYRLARIANR